MLKALAKAPAGLFFSELWKKAEVSERALSAFLRRLQHYGCIIRDENRKYHITQVGSAQLAWRKQEPDKLQLSLLEDLLSWLEKNHPGEIGSFLHATTLAFLSLVTCHVTNTMYRAFNITQPSAFDEVVPLVSSQTPQIETVDMNRSPDWIADTLVDSNIRTEILALVGFFKTNLPGTRTPIYQRAEVWKAVRKIENAAVEALSENEPLTHSRKVRASSAAERGAS
jgi:DNA-binding HxlR family transcriptional regulator